MEEFALGISNVTFNQAKSLFNKHSHRLQLHGSMGDLDSLQDVTQFVYHGLYSLEELFQRLPDSVGICIEMKYPTSAEKRDLELTQLMDIHSYVDTILKLVYDNAHHRSIIFSSFNPAICTHLNWKQPNYGVFFGTHCGLTLPKGPWKELLKNLKEQDSKCTSMKEAVKFAKNSNLLGLLCEAYPLVISFSLTL